MVRRAAGRSVRRVAPLLVLATSMVVGACSFAWEDYEPSAGAGGGATAGSTTVGPGSGGATGSQTATATSGSGAANGGGGAGAAGGASTSASMGSGGAGGMVVRTGDCMQPFLAGDPSTQNGDTSNLPDSSDPSCMPGGSNDAVYQVTVAVTGVLVLTLDSATDMGIYVQTVCGDEGTEIGCTDEGGGGDTEELKLLVTQGDTVFVFVDGFGNGEEGPFTLDIASRAVVCGDGLTDPGEGCDPPDGVTCDGGCQVLPEICTDAADNDQDGLTDCEDVSDCAGDGACPLGAECPGAVLVPNVMADTTTGTNDFAGSCVGDELAPEKIYSYTALGDGLLLLTLASAEDLGVYARDDCASPSSEIVCVDNHGGGTDEHLGLPMGIGENVSLFVDGFQSFDAGPFVLTSSFMATDEAEPNDDTTQANGYIASFTGTIYPPGDEDFVEVIVPGPSSTLTVEVLEIAPGACADDMIESELQIYDTDGTSTLDYDDDGGVGACSKSIVSGLSAGTYYVRVSSPTPSAQNGIFGYTLDVIVN